MVVHLQVGLVSSPLHLCVSGFGSGWMEKKETRRET